MKINISKKYQILGGIFFIIIIILIIQIIESSTLSKEVTKSIPDISTPSASIVLPPINPVESTEEWNTQFNKSLEEYSKTDKARIDKNLSYIRKNSPIIETGFQIEYDYSNATYTFTIDTPVKENRENLLSWLNYFDISEKDLEFVRVEWITAP